MKEARPGGYEGRKMGNVTREEEKMELKKLHNELISLFEKSEDKTRWVLFSCLVQDLDMKNSRQWLEVWNDPKSWK